MMNFKLRNGFYSRVLFFVLFAQTLVFTQCKKEQEIEPDPIAQEGSNAVPADTTEDTGSIPDDGGSIPNDGGGSIPDDGGSNPIDETPTTELPVDEPSTPVTPTTPKPSTPTTPKPTTPTSPKPTTPTSPKPTTPTTPTKPTVPTKPTTPTSPTKPTTPTKPTVPVKPVPTVPKAPVIPSVASYVIKSNEQIVDGAEIKVAPGGVIKLEGGSRGPLLLKNFAGSAGMPITIVTDGNTVINSSGSYGFKTENCKYFRLTGSTGSGYGLTVNGGHIGMSFDKLTTEFTVDHVEVKNCGFAGIMAKTDPGCDQSTWRNNFTMSNLKFFNNYIHDVKGEGFYIGNSFYASGRELSCGNILPHAVTNVDIYNNKINNTGCEGIQAGCVTSGLKIHNNTVENYGISPFASAQNNGVQIGEGSSGLLYNNIIKKGPGNGIIVLGSGNTKIYNNLVIDAGSMGAFVDNRGPASGDIVFVNNTFINPGEGGIKNYNELVKNKYYNNIFAGTTNYFSYGSGATGEESNNLCKASMGDCGFVNPGSGNYQLSAGSAAKDKGLNAAGYGVTTDLANKRRPSGAAHDIGAYEF